MTFRQHILKRVYPVWMWFTRQAGKRIAILKNTENKEPFVPFYSLSAVLNNGDTLAFDTLKGKKVLLVNTASDCGYTHQYKTLQQLQQKFIDTLVVIGFPANDFNQQEKGNDVEIAAFCERNYGVTFFIAAKTNVRGENKNEIFTWLSDKSKNGWNEKKPAWNFSKYLVSEDGELLFYFDAGISPMSNTVIHAIETK